MIRLFDELITNSLGIQNRMVVAKNLNSWRFKKYLRKRSVALCGEVYREYVENSKPLREEDGYGYLPFLGKELIEAVIRDSEIVIGSGKHKTSTKGFMVNYLENQHLHEYPSFLNVALSPDIIRSAAEYLGCIPILSSIKVLVSHSNMKSSELTSSQLFHLDHSDRPLFKVIVNLNRVDRDNGPFTFIPKSPSLKIQSIVKSGWNRRSCLVQDKDIFDIITEDEIVRLTGEAGDAYFVDSSNCFHFGSRNPKRERKLLMMSYLSPCRADFRDPFDFLRFRPNSSELESWILDPFAKLGFYPMPTEG